MAGSRIDGLVQDLAKDVAVQKEQLKRLRAAIDIGDRDLAEARYTEINTDAELRAFFDDIKRRGRARRKRSALPAFFPPRLRAATLLRRASQPPAGKPKECDRLE